MKSNTNNKDSVIAVVLLLLIVFQLTKIKYFISITILYIVLALLFEKIAFATDFIWKKITHVLGKISSTILFSILFFVVFFPVGALLKLFKKGSFLRFSAKRPSTFQMRNKLFTKEDLEQPF
ncbi:MAG: hypothetical protein ABJA78_09675 [Ferruginibacter sp.]